MTAPSQPRTASGRALLPELSESAEEWLGPRTADYAKYANPWALNAILAIEVEAAQQAREALTELLAAAFRGDDFLTQNNVPMESTPNVRRALARARAALDAARPVGDARE